jgi:hypothetical protein
MKKIEFSEVELQPVGEYPSMFPGVPPTPIYQTPVTPKENYRALYSGETPSWIPNFYDLTTFCPACYPDAIARGFVVSGESGDFIDDSTKGGKDLFGIDWIYEPSAMGSMVVPGNPTLQDISEWRDKITLPDVESWDWAKSADRNKEYAYNSPNLVQGWIFTGFFERLISLLDFENAAITMIDEESEEDVHDFFNECTKIYKKIIKHYKEDFNVDVIYFHDDWGTSRNPFFSLDACRTMIVPHLKEVADYAHELGMFIELHSCGKSGKLVPAMIEAGIDAWTPQEINDFDELYNEYAGKIMLGAYHLLPMDVDEEKASATGREFVEKYADSISEKPVFSGDYAINNKTRESLYVESRKRFN